MTVVRDLGELPPSNPQTNPLNHLFVPSDDPLLLHLLVTTASSFSISLGAWPCVWVCVCISIYLHTCID
jgi:hypothetical protein